MRNFFKNVIVKTIFISTLPFSLGIFFDNYTKSTGWKVGLILAAVLYVAADVWYAWEEYKEQKDLRQHRMDEQEREALIRRDFQEAFRHVKYGGDLGSDIRYALSDRDLRHLAELHKANHCRKKIEDLLTACNYHYECGRFMNREYDEFLQCC